MQIIPVAFDYMYYVKEIGEDAVRIRKEVLIINGVKQAL